MILPFQTIIRGDLVRPWHTRSSTGGMTYGAGPAGYDIRLAEDLSMWPLRFALASTIERFDMPDDVLAVVHDKSSWARRGLSVLNTIIEPGWRGYLTLELKNLGFRWLRLKPGMPIAQVVFHRLEERTVKPYPADGKYQNQKSGPQPALFGGS